VGWSLHCHCVSESQHSVVHLHARAASQTPVAELSQMQCSQRQSCCSTARRRGVSQASHHLSVAVTRRRPTSFCWRRSRSTDSEYRETFSARRSRRTRRSSPAALLLAPGLTASGRLHRPSGVREGVYCELIISQNYDKLFEIFSSKYLKNSIITPYALRFVRVITCAPVPLIATSRVLLQQPFYFSS
jgi:hypothetical protein